MPEYLIDENLPYYLNLWNNDRFIHIKDLQNIKTDEEIWNYALKNNLIIVSKDSDFSYKIMLHNPSPKIIHIRFGNMKIQDFYNTINKLWPVIEKEIQNHKLVNVFIDRLEVIE